MGDDEEKCPACDGTGLDVDAIMPDGRYGDCRACAATGKKRPQNAAPDGGKAPGENR